MILKIEMINSTDFIVYYFLVLDDILEYEIEEVKTFIKVIVAKLVKNYQITLKGYYHLDVYVNKILILEFKNIDDYEEEVDLNIKIHLKTPILVEFEDYFLLPGKKYYQNQKYYQKIEEIEYPKYVEFTKIVYNNQAKEIMNKGITL